MVLCALAPAHSAEALGSLQIARAFKEVANMEIVFAVKKSRCELLETELKFYN